MKKKIFLISVSLFIIAEIALRISFPNRFKIGYRPVIYRHLPEVNYGYVPDTCFSLFGNMHRINHQGFIGNDFGEKTSDSLRIAVVGSSSVSGSAHLKSFYSFCPLLQQQFTLKNKKVQVLNCGVDGNERSLELFKSIRYQVVNLKPDIILLEYSLPFYSSNNIRENYNGYILSYPAFDRKGRAYQIAMVDKLNKYKVLLDLLHHSYIMRVIIHLYTKNSKSKLTWYIDYYRSRIFVYGKFTPIAYTMEESIEMVQTLNQELKDMKIQLFLFQYDKNEHIITTAKNHKLPLISLGMSFSGEDYFDKDEHWNNSGCQKIANRIYELLMKYNLVSEQYL